MQSTFEFEDVLRARDCAPLAIASPWGAHLVRLIFCSSHPGGTKFLTDRVVGADISTAKIRSAALTL